MVAFDYDQQCWLEGEEAIALRRRQLTEEREIVAGPRGAEFLRFSVRRGQPVPTVAESLARIDAELSQC